MAKQQARLENWSRFGEQLVGEVYGHPRFEDGEVVRTSRVLKMDDKVAETMNTDYTLGEQAHG